MRVGEGVESYKRGNERKMVHTTKRLESESEFRREKVKYKEI